MALTDPQSVTIDGSTISLPRISVGENKSTYKSADGDTALVATHTYGRRIRRTVRVDQQKISPDPFIPANNIRNSGSVVLFFDYPLGGFDSDDQLEAYKGLHGLLSASTYANLAKILGGES